MIMKMMLTNYLSGLTAHNSEYIPKWIHCISVVPWPVQPSHVGWWELPSSETPLSEGDKWVLPVK